MPRRRYDNEHRRARAAGLATLPPGSPCARCGHEMWPGEDRLDLDHDEDGGYLGFSHHSPCQTCGERCNQKAGGEKAALQAGKKLRRRRCVICGIPYEATSGSSGARQASCGQNACQSELRRRRAARTGEIDPEGPPPVTGRVW